MAVTTDRFAEAAEAFRRVGLTPVWLPCIRIEPAAEDVLAEAREAASIADLVLISSVRTLDVLWDNRTMPAVAVAAVGERTAAAVTARGGRVVIVGRAGLADLVERSTHQFGSSQVVFLHASGSDPAALEQLLASATNLRMFEVYRSVPVAPALTPVQAAAFASPSAVEGWLLSRVLDGVVIGVIGATTGDAVARHRPPEVVAAQPQYQALADDMASYLEVAV